MKTIATFLFALSLVLTVNTNAQNFQVQIAKQNHFDPSALLNAYGSKGTINYQNYQVKEMPSYQTPVQSPATETRVTGYYYEGYGANVTWKRMNLKVEVVTNSLGRDELKAVAYKKDDSNYWITLSYSNVTKTYGDIAKEFSYQVYVGGNFVYFNI